MDVLIFSLQFRFGRILIIEEGFQDMSAKIKNLPKLSRNGIAEKRLIHPSSAM